MLRVYKEDNTHPCDSHSPLQPSTQRALALLLVPQANFLRNGHAGIPSLRSYNSKRHFSGASLGEPLLHRLPVDHVPDGLEVFRLAVLIL